MIRIYVSLDVAIVQDLIIMIAIVVEILQDLLLNVLDSRNCLVSIGTFSCSSCIDSYVLIDQLCILNPLYYSANNLISPIVDAEFTSFQQYYGIFQSGSNASNWYENNVDPDDPILVKQRGISIYPYQYLKSHLKISLNS